MTLPKHIQDGLDRSIELQKQIAERKTAEPAPGSPESEAFKQDAATVTDVKVGDDVENDTHIQDQDGDDTQDTEPKEAPKEEPKPKDEDVEHWKQKFRTLEGKYNAEVPRYAGEVRQLKQEIQNLKTAVQVAPKTESAPAIEWGTINPDDYEEYGEDMKKLASQISKLVGTVQELKTENDSLKTQVGTVYQASEQTNFDSFLGKVRQAYPSFDEQDRDPDFIDWVERMGIDLNGIGQSRNVNKAVEVYKAYAQVSGKYQPKPPVVEPPANPAVQKQVVPPKSRPAPAPDGQKKKMWTRDEINKVYEDIKLGFIKEEQAYKLKQEIFTANAEGRVS